MPILTFTGANALPSNLKTTEIVFSYFVDDSAEAHQISISGNVSQEAFTREELIDYAQHLFSAALFVIDFFWDSYKKLPDEATVYREDGAYKMQDMQPLAWDGYKVTLV